MADLSHSRASSMFQHADFAMPLIVDVTIDGTISAGDFDRVLVQFEAAIA